MIPDVSILARPFERALPEHFGICDRVRSFQSSTALSSGRYRITENTSCIAALRHI